MTLATSSTNSNRALATTAHSRTTSEISTYIVANSQTSAALSAKSETTATKLKA